MTAIAVPSVFDSDDSGIQAADRVLGSLLAFADAQPPLEAHLQSRRIDARSND